MRATFDIPDDLYRQVAAKSAAEGRPLHELALELFRGYLGSASNRQAAQPASNRQAAQAAPAGAASTARSAPPWFGIFKEQAKKVRDHDMASIRRSIARGIVEERDL